MKKTFITILIHCISLGLVMAQNVQLRSNGFVSEFKAIDTLHYTEYKLEGKSATDLKRQDPTTLILRQSFGKTSKESPRASEGVFYTTRYYAFSDGTLQAPTSQIFFKPVDLGKFVKEVKGIGTVEPHPFLDGYYFLNITDKNWLNGEKIFSLCNTLFELQLASVIEPVFIKHIKTENPLRPLQWNIRNNANVPGGVIGADMNVEHAWNMGATGTGIRVAVIDDGVDLTHPDLVNNLLPGFDATGNNSGGAPTADNGHGTNCAGIIAATDNTDGVIGVAFNAQIIPIRMGIANNMTGEINTNDTWIVNCFNEAINRGADVISCSWGNGSPSAQINAVIQNAVNNGRGNRGCIVLFAAGNKNSAVSYPASNPSVIAVGASSTCDTRKRSSSNPALVYPGVTPDPEGVSCDGDGSWGSNFGLGLDVIAPGVWISTTDNAGANGFVAGNYNDRFRGTSAACPNAAGVVALILSVNPNMTGVQARNILEQTCFKIPNGNFQANVAGQPNGTWSNQAGYGRVDAGAAVCRAIETGTLLAVAGPTLVCTNSTFTLNNPPPGAVTWSVAPSNRVSPSNGTGTVANVTRISNGSAVITFNIMGCANVNRSLSFHAGPYSSSNYPITGPSSASCNSNVFYSIPTLSGVTSINWVWPSGWTYISGQNTASLALRTNSSGGVVAVGVNNTCGQSGSYATRSTAVTGFCGSRFAVYPNPASSELTISFIDTTATDVMVSTGQEFESAYDVQIFNQFQEIIYATRTSRTRITIPISNFPNGTYYLNILNKEGVIQRKIFVNKN